MPWPWSATITVPCVSSTVTRPPSGLHFAALSSRLVIARSSAAGSPVTHHGSVCTSNSTVVARRRTRVTAWPTTAASSTGSTDGVFGSSRASSTRSPISVVISEIWARTSSSSSLRGLLGEPVRGVGLGQQVEVGAQRGQRGAQLVAGVGDQLALPGLGGRQRGEHRVERLREPGHLVVALDRDRVEPLGAGDVLDGVGEPAYRPQAVAGHRPAGQSGADHPGEAEEQHHQAEPVEHLVGRLQRLGQDQRLAVVGRHRDHPVALAVEVDRARRPRLPCPARPATSPRPIVLSASWFSGLTDAVDACRGR